MLTWGRFVDRAPRFDVHLQPKQRHQRDARTLARVQVRREGLDDTREAEDADEDAEVGEQAQVPEDGAQAKVAQVFENQEAQVLRGRACGRVRVRTRARARQRE